MFAGLVHCYHAIKPNKCKEGNGAMLERGALSMSLRNPAWCRLFREISYSSPLKIGTLFRCCALGKGSLPSHASLDLSVNEYLVGQRWPCVRYASKWLQECMLSMELKWHTNEQVQWPGGKNVKVGWNTWYQTINMFLLHLHITGKQLLLFVIVNSRCWSNVGLMLGQRRRQWASIKSTLPQRIVFAVLFPPSKSLKQYLPTFQISSYCCLHFGRFIAILQTGYLSSFAFSPIDCKLQ